MNPGALLCLETQQSPVLLFLGFYVEKPRKDLSGPVLRDTARLSQRYPPIARYGVFGVSTWPIGCDTPSPRFLSVLPLESMRSGGAISPPQKGYLSDTCAIPSENKANGCDTPPPSAILSRKGIARYGGVSRTGPLRERPRKHQGFSDPANPQNPCKISRKTPEKTKEIQNSKNTKETKTPRKRRTGRGMKQ